MNKIAIYNSSLISEITQNQQVVESSDPKDAKAQIAPVEPQPPKQAPVSEQPTYETPYYLSAVKQIEEVATALQSSLKDPLCGLSSAIHVEEAIVALEELAESDYEEEFLQGEIRHIAWQLEDWMKAIQERELYRIAQEEYQKDPSEQNQQRLQLIQQEASTLREKLPSMQMRWQQLTKKLQIEDHDDYFPQIQELLEKIPSPSTSQPLPQEVKESLSDLPQPKRSWLGQALHTLWHAEEWSDTTKDLVFRGCALMQLTAGCAQFFHEKNALPGRAAAMQKELLKNLPEDTKQQIEKNTATLGTLLSDKWEALQDPAIREKFLKKIPEARGFFSEMFSKHVEQPTPEQIRTSLDYFQMQSAVRAHPHANPFQAKLAALEEGIASLLSLKSEEAKKVNEEILTLREEVRTFSRALQKGVEEPPAPTCPRDTFSTWVENMAEMSYSLKTLEERASALVAKTRGIIDSYTLSASEKDLSAYGNKHKNNIKQARLARAVDFENLEVPVPEGVRTEEVLAHLQKTAPEVFSAWRELQIKQTLDETLLSQIDAGIEKAFQTFPISTEMKNWLNKIKAKGSYLMVRSTGAEDSRKAANAGGNLSVPYVAPNEKDLRAALGQVVRSYFGKSSLQNRLNAGLKPFEEELSLAVTAQELIGEPIGGSQIPRDIPVSLVAFSNEPLFIGDEKFRVMRISATYGHGEGVVGNQGIESDTILVLHSYAKPDRLYILYDNHEKTERLAPVQAEDGEITLQKIANPAHMVKKPALDGKQIARLFEWGVLAESYFEDNATDMEIVIKGNKIYPVQARPVNRKALLPTYLDRKKIAENGQELILESVHNDVLVPGKASVLNIENPEEVLTAETLEQAERAFEKDKHKLVIVYKSEPANSHPVVNFSSMGVPCLYASEKEAMQNLLAKRQPLAVCMQAGDVHIWNPEQGKIEEYTSKGFTVHPAKIAISQSVSATLAEDAGAFNEVPKEVEDLMRRIQIAHTQESAFASLKQLRQHDWLKSFLKQTHHIQNSLQKQVKPIAKAASALKQSVSIAFSELETLYNQTQIPGRLESLLRVKVLETLLFAPAKISAALGQYSVTEIDKNLAAAKTLAKYQQKLPHTAHFADILLAGTQSPNDKVFENWQNFLLSLEPLAEEKKISAQQILRLKQIIHFFQEASILPIYLTFFFDNELTVWGKLKSYVFDSSQPIGILENLLDSCSKKDEKNITEILKQKKAIQKLQTDLTGFSHPKTFDKAFASLRDQQNKIFGNLLSKEKWALSSASVRFTALEMLKDFTNTFDLAIKTMKVSPHFTDEQKVPLFKRMLLPYFAFLKETIENILPENAFDDIPGQMSVIEQILENLSDTELNQLQPSPDFSVAAAAFGSGAAFDRHHPQTLEDVFTLTHQNLLASNGWLSNQILENENIEDRFPSALNVVLSNLEKVGGNGVGTPQRIETKITSKKIKLQYNVPLRQHSGSLLFNYDKQTGSVEIEARFMGMNERDRWPRAKEHAEILSHFGVIKLSKPIQQNNNEIRIIWQAKEKEDSVNILEFFQLLAEMSFLGPYAVNLKRYIEQKLNGKFDSDSVSNLLDYFNQYRILGWCDFFLNALDSAAKREGAYRKVFESAYELFDSDRWMVLSIVQHFFKKNIGYPEAIELAKKNFEAGDLKAINLFNLLFEKGQGYQEAIETAKALSEREPYYAYQLFEKLIEKGQGYAEAIETAKSLIEKSPIFALALFEKLIEIGQGYQEGIDGAKRLIESAPQQAYELFKKLIEKDQGYAEAIEGAKALSEREPYYAYQLFAKLIEIGQGYAEAIEAAKSLTEREPYYAYHLFEKLIEIGQGYAEAIEGAKKLLERDPEVAAQLFIKLVEKGQGYQEAIEGAKKLLEEEPWIAGSLYEELVEKEQSYQEAIEFAKRLAEGGIYWNQVIALFEKLVEKGQGYQEMIEVAKILKKSTFSFSIYYRSFVEIYQSLVEKGRAISEAIEFAKILYKKDPSLASELYEKAKSFSPETE